MICKRKTLAAIAAAGGLISVAPVLAQDASATSTSIIVTLEPKHSKTIPPIVPEDIAVSAAGQNRSVTELKPLGDSGAQILLLIDDSAQFSFDTEIGVIKQFVSSLPQNVEIGIGYMHNGMSQMVQEFTTDHAAAANSIRLPLGPGGGDVSPYDSLSDAIKKWPKSDNPRREVIMISSGIEALGGGFAPENPYVNKAIADALRAGIIVYSIYSPSVGHYGHTFWRETWGQNFLSQMSDETGGEAFITTIGPPVTFGPYFDSILKDLRNQYLLTFSPGPANKTGLVPLRVRIKEKDADIAAPTSVFVKASQ